MTGRSQILAVLGVSGALAVGAIAVASGDGASALPEADQSGASSGPCAKGFVRDEVERYIEAANSGSPDAIEAALTDEPAFRVFSHGLDHRRRPKRFFMAKGEAKVVTHLVRRAAKGDQARIAELDIGDADRSFRICGFGYVVWRDIGDRPKRGERFIGKGAVSMDGGIAVWNTGQPKRYLR